MKEEQPHFISKVKQRKKGKEIKKVTNFLPKRTVEVAEKNLHSTQETKYTDR